MLLDSMLSGLDIPSDGSAKLVSVKLGLDDAGCQTWTVVFKAVKSSAPSLQPSCTPEPTATTAAAPTPAQTPTTPPSATPRKLNQTVSFAEPTSEKFLPIAVIPKNPGKPRMQDPLMDRIFPLKCQVKTYDWGKRGLDSLVGRLAAEGLDDFELEAKTPYAELWMGTHPSGAANVTLSSPWRTVTPLSEWIKLNPSLLGPPRSHKDDAPARTRRKSMVHMEQTSLPFLFKVLSVRTALSIQAHPDKHLAAELHVRHPDMYKDDNHKPEMAVAITPFEALCSFLPAYSVLANCRATPELVALIGEDSVSRLDDATNERAAAQRGSPMQGMASTTGAGSSSSSSSSSGADAHTNFKVALRMLFSRLMSAAADRVQTQLEALMKRVQSTNTMLRAPVDVLAMRLHEQYPGDVGVFCVYLLNYTQLQPGEALFLAANEPHAYISGDCAEVMATSDNVVRAGCTKKWKDVDTLCDMLTYSDGTPHFVQPERQPGEPHVWRYAPPDVVDEFILDRVELPSAGLNATLGASSGLAILLVVSGAAEVEQLDDSTSDAVGLRHQLTCGATHLVCPHTVLRIKALQPKTLIFQAAAKPPGETLPLY